MVVIRVAMHHWGVVWAGGGMGRVGSTVGLLGDIVGEQQGW